MKGNNLSVQEQLYLKSRIDNLVIYVNHEKYYSDIAKIIRPKNGVKSITRLTENELSDLLQYLDNVESNSQLIDDSSSDEELDFATSESSVQDKSYPC
jgi:hypothetical protein